MLHSSTWSSRNSITSCLSVAAISSSTSALFTIASSTMARRSIFLSCACVEFCFWYHTIFCMFELIQGFGSCAQARGILWRKCLKWESSGFRSKTRRSQWDAHFSEVFNDLCFLETLRIWTSWMQLFVRIRSCCSAECPFWMNLFLQRNWSVSDLNRLTYLGLCWFECLWTNRSSDHCQHLLRPHHLARWTLNWPTSSRCHYLLFLPMHHLTFPSHSFLLISSGPDAEGNRQICDSKRAPCSSWS